MRFLELLVTDLVDDTADDVRPEWIHREHIETIRAYIPDIAGPTTLWLELTLTSGRFRYIPVRAIRADEVDDAARTAIAVLLEDGNEPVRALADDANDAARPDLPDSGEADPIPRT